MDENNLYLVVKGSLDGMAGGPKLLAPAMEFQSKQLDQGHQFTEEDILAHILSSKGEGQLCDVIRRKLQAWDHFSESNWTAETSANTPKRRERIYQLLSLGQPLKETFQSIFPPYLPEDEVVIIAKEHEQWYDNGKSSLSSFYWSAYSEYLQTHPKWPEHSILELDRSTTEVLERLSCPWRAEAFQSKGLVVGYVQSGKTAHFTGLIAKASDAGYRLIIVLAGTINLLRAQTQRRLDKELIGREFLEDEYVSDPDWSEFLSHHGRPSELGAFDWKRLTGPKDDYTSLRYGIETLDFQRKDSSLPFYDSSNLRGAPACIMVVKKIPSRLKQVARDLGRIRARLADIPALVIDDESDQASLNTIRNINTQEAKRRTATNKAITNLLAQLPRAQYVGYTATPFANVFVDPNDALDLFPKDFIISLTRPIGYMGAQDFHDIGVLAPPDLSSNERAFVRDIHGPDGDRNNLLKAIDSYILSGAIKLFRSRDNASVNIKHHTMLIHESHLIHDHEILAEEIEKTINRAAYYSPSGMERLERLWEHDFKPVIIARNQNPEDIPDSFDDLREDIAKTLWNLNFDSSRVLIVNGDNNEDTPDFDRQPVWSIIVGGTKLSRGYTIEGLTVSYYRRATQSADTLMQMGRWFGFRRGYQDLVRLFIGRDEPYLAPPKRRVDLYRAFEAVCLDEMEFRDELKRYAKPEEGDPITPAQVPPLVSAHLLLPTSRNKMFNAIIEFENFGGKAIQRTIAPVDFKDVSQNVRIMRKLLHNIPLETANLGIMLEAEEYNADFIFGHLENNRVQEFIQNYLWSDGKLPLERLSEFLNGNHGHPEIDNWLFLSPMLKDPTYTWECSGVSFSIVSRQRVGLSGRYQVYSDPVHITIAEYFTGINNAEHLNKETKQLKSQRQGVFLFYPVRARKDQQMPDKSGNERYVTMGFVILCPKNSITAEIKFSVKNKDEPEAVIIDVESG